jgi:hypothetical protein
LRGRVSPILSFASRASSRQYKVSRSWSSKQLSGAPCLSCADSAHVLPQHCDAEGSLPSDLLRESLFIDLAAEDSYAVSIRTPRQPSPSPPSPSPPDRTSLSPITKAIGLDSYLGSPGRHKESITVRRVTRLRLVVTRQAR